MGRPPQYDKTRTTTSFRLPAHLVAALKAAAGERDVSVNWLVIKALEEFLPRLLPVDEIVWTRPVRPEPPDRAAGPVDVTEGPLPPTRPDPVPEDPMHGAYLLARYADWPTDQADLHRLVKEPKHLASCYWAALSACASSKLALHDIDAVYRAMTGSDSMTT